jgi:hypothetical protein
MIAPIRSQEPIVEDKYKRSCKIVLAGGCIEEFDSLSHRHFWKGVGGVVSVSNVGFLSVLGPACEPVTPKNLCF